MVAQDIVEAARASFAPVGFNLPSIGIPTVPPIGLQRDAVHRLEAAGYRNGWANEGVGAKDVFVQIALLLNETRHLTFGTSITPMWARPPMVLHAAARQLAEAFPGRFVLGVGAGYDFMASMVGLAYGNPVANLRRYVHRMTEPTPILESPSANYATILGSIGRKSVRQAAEIADGALPALIPPAYTAELRSILGPQKLLVVGLSTYIDDDEDAARKVALQSVIRNTSFPNSPFARILDGLGYTEQERSSGTRRLVDDLTAYGPARSIAAAAQRHLDAGADHVILQPVAPTFSQGVEQLEKIAPTITTIAR